MNTYFVYGFKESNIERIRSQIETALRINMVIHQSLYYGGDYYLHQGDNLEKIILRKNFDLIDNEPYEIDFKDFNLLLCVEINKGESQIKTKLDQINRIPNIEFLKSK